MKRKKKHQQQLYRTQQKPAQQKNTSGLLVMLKAGIFLSLFLFLIPFYLLSHDGIFSGHDIQTHVIYLLLFTKAVIAGQIPVRWIDWVHPGFNQPLFTFYQPLFYYLFQIPRMLGFANTTSLKIEVGILWVLSGITMYAFTKEYFGKVPALFSGIIYLYAPYHILDIFVRAALPEFLALTIIPFLFWSMKRYATTKKLFYFLLTSLSVASLLTAHPPTLIMFLPFIFFYLFYLAFVDKNFMLLFLFLGSFLFGACLSSFFLIPLVFEQSFIQPMYLHSGYYDFHQHFVCIQQLFTPNWGYGISVPDCSDDLSFQVGISNWVIFFTAIGILWWRWEKQTQAMNILLVGTISIFVLVCCLTLPVTQRIWESNPYVALIQYPWRFLSVTIFLSAILGGYLLWNIRNTVVQYSIYFVSVIIVFLLSAWYLHPAQWLSSFASSFDMAQTQDFSSTVPEIGYMPKGAIINPDKASTPQSQIKLISGKAHITRFTDNTTKKEYRLVSEVPTQFIFYVHQYPGWKAYVDGKQTPIRSDNLFGFIELTTQAGAHTITLQLTDTPLRKISNLISGISFLLFGIGLLWSFLLAKKIFFINITQKMGRKNKAPETTE